MPNTPLDIRRAVITGPTGAVGVALINELVAHGIEVVAASREDSKRLSSIPGHPLVRVVKCSLDHYARLPELVGEKCDVFYHFAWDGTFGASRQDWATQAKNVAFSVDAVCAAHELGCKVFIGAGSQSEFGHVDGVLHPDMPCNPDNGYGAAKLAACEMTKAYCAHLGVRHEWCRILSLFGPGDGEYTLISQVIRKLLAHEHLSCTRGDQVWDYIYSRDAARAFRLVAERGTNGSVYCFGTGKTRALREYIEAVRDIIDPSAQIGFGEIDYYPNQVMHLEADIANLKEDTGFEPKFSFEEGILETIRSIKDTE